MKVLKDKYGENFYFTDAITVEMIRERSKYFFIIGCFDFDLYNVDLLFERILKSISTFKTIMGDDCFGENFPIPIGMVQMVQETKVTYKTFNWFGFKSPQEKVCQIDRIFYYLAFDKPFSKESLEKWHIFKAFWRFSSGRR